MQDIAQCIYDTTPGIQDDIPRHTSKILQNVKTDKKAASGQGNKPGAGQADATNEMLYEDWQSKYEEILNEYKNEK